MHPSFIYQCLIHALSHLNSACMAGTAPGTGSSLENAILRGLDLIILPKHPKFFLQNYLATFHGHWCQHPDSWVHLPTFSQSSYMVCDVCNLHNKQASHHADIMSMTSLACYIFDYQLSYYWDSPSFPHHPWWSKEGEISKGFLPSFSSGTSCPKRSCQHQTGLCLTCPWRFHSCTWPWVSRALCREGEEHTHNFRLTGRLSHICGILCKRQSSHPLLAFGKDITWKRLLLKCGSFTS